MGMRRVPPNAEPPRAQSMTGSMVAMEDASDQVDEQRLYEAVLKILILEYRNESRFKTPIVAKTAPSSDLSPQNSRGGKPEEDTTLPTYLVAALEKRLNLVAMKRADVNLNEPTRRSLLRFYSELLDPKFKQEVKKVNKPEYLVMKFVVCANKELIKLGSASDGASISASVIEQTGTFVQMLISLVQSDRSGEQVKARLREYKDSLGKPRTTNGDVATVSSATYKQPSFRLSDMEVAKVEIVYKLFDVNEVKLQQDVFRLKELASERTLQQDIKQVQFFLGKDLGQSSERDFVAKEFYEAWRQREEGFCQQILAKYQPVAANKLPPVPPLPAGEDFYILPSIRVARSFFVHLLKKCLELEPLSSEANDEPQERRLFSKHALDIISLCSKFWRIDFPTRATSLYTAAHLAGILTDKLEGNKPSDPGPVDIVNTITVMQFCKRIVEDLGKLDWEAKGSWNHKDQEVWGRNLMWTFNSVLISIREALSLIFSKSVKPKFGPYLQFLGEYVESDSLFVMVEDSGVTSKWQKKLSRTLLRVAESRYAELLAHLPRDDTLSIMHILDISDNIVQDIRNLQRRYKNPLLGFLDVPKTVAAVITGMFAADSKNILKHISTYAKQKQQLLPYGDALEAYKSLYEIRSIYNQVTTSHVFRFDLEAFFYPFLEAWVAESAEKVQAIINEAILRDNFEPIDVEDDNKKYSLSVLDIFTLVREYLKIIKGLNWSNEYQCAKVYTVLLQSISEGMLTYSSKISELIINDLNEEDSTEEVFLAEPEKRKSGSWFDEVKNVVSNATGQKAIDAEVPYDFKSQTCVALNNLSAMMDQLTKLEEYLDPELISQTVNPRNFNHDGLPQEIYLDLDTQGRVLVEIAVESERADAIFVMGRAHRNLKRCQDRCIKLIVQKFSRFIHLCFSRSNLKALCGSSGSLKPTQDQMDQAMMPLYTYLNSNLQILAQYLSKDLLMKVMLAAWLVVVSSADSLLLPKLTSAKTFKISSFGSKLSSSNTAGSGANASGSSGWQSAVASAMINMGNSIGISGFGKSLTNTELETVFSWLNFLCLDFFHNNGNGPPVSELKNAQYQALLLLPVYYDRDVDFLIKEVERLSPAYVTSLRDRNNFSRVQSHKGGNPTKRGGTLSRASTLVRKNTIGANATVKARKQAAQDAQEALSDPISAQSAAEDIILRLLLIKDQKAFVARRLEQRERLAHSISTEMLARAAAESVRK
ncbi:C2 domain-containing protein [[Candida] zeylanoides]